MNEIFDDFLVIKNERNQWDFWKKLLKSKKSRSFSKKKVTFFTFFISFKNSLQIQWFFGHFFSKNTMISLIFFILPMISLIFCHFLTKKKVKKSEKKSEKKNEKKVKKSEKSEKKHEKSDFFSFCIDNLVFKSDKKSHFFRVFCHFLSFFSLFFCFFWKWPWFLWFFVI